MDTVSSVCRLTRVPSSFSPFLLLYLQSLSLIISYPHQGGLEGAGFQHSTGYDFSTGLTLLLAT